MPGVGTSCGWQDGESANIDYFVRLCYDFRIVKIGDTLSLSVVSLQLHYALSILNLGGAIPSFPIFRSKCPLSLGRWFISQMQHVSVRVLAGKSSEEIFQ